MAKIKLACWKCFQIRLLNKYRLCKRCNQKTEPDILDWKKLPEFTFKGDISLKVVSDDDVKKKRKKGK